MRSWFRLRIAIFLAQALLFVALLLPADSTRADSARTVSIAPVPSTVPATAFGFAATATRNCYGYGYGCGYGYGYGYPYLGGGVDPYWWWDSDSSGDQDQQYQIGLANEMNQQSLDEQQMRRIRADQDAYARYCACSPASEPKRTEADPATVLVFRDQHKQEIHNYAIVGQTLWNFSPQRTQKIPLSNLDLPATEKANEDRGVDFRPPGANEGQ